MPIALNTFIVAISSRWWSVGGQLLASCAALLSGHQDIGLRSRVGAFFGFLMATAFGVSALATAIRTKLWGGAAICTVILCLEIVFIVRWWSRRTSL